MEHRAPTVERRRRPRHPPPFWARLTVDNPRMDLTRFPTEAALFEAIAVRPIHIIVTGHLCLDEILTVAIAESMVDPSAAELDRFRFPQKVGLAVALGIVPSDSRPAFLKLNQLRNDLAHRSMDDLLARDLPSIIATLSAAQLGLTIDIERTEAANDMLSCAKFLITVLYRELRNAVETRRERRLRAAARADMWRETLEGANFGNAWAEARRVEEEEITKRVAQKKQLLGYDYQSPAGGPPFDPFELVGEP
jgi:hypothetical protein